MKNDDLLAWDLLEAQAETLAGKDFLRFHSGRVSYAAILALAEATAGRLHTAGVRPGDIVPTFLPNGIAAAAAWFALMRLGAVWAPINTEFRGAQLVAALNATGARLIVLAPHFAELIAGVLPDLPSVQDVIVVGAPAPDMGPVRVRGLEDIAAETPAPCAGVERTTIAMIQFTSGSTGVSKPVQLSHGYLVGQARLTSRHFDLRESDVVYCPFPLYHWDATIGTVMGSLVTGATAALGERFSVSRFWDDIRAFDATMFDFMGSTLTFLYQRPPDPRDREHRVRLAWGLPMPEFRADFEARFGFPLFEGYGSTEGGVCVFQNLGETYPKGSCGRTAPEFALKLLDDAGNPVPTGEVGEIVTRPHDPTLMFSGYLGMPEVNAELIRDGWYYTGDLGRLDAAGNLYFAGRKKDIIRRRGENMSALEIERAIETHPAVFEAAAFGVPSPATEEDVAVAVVLRPGAVLTDDELRAYCEGRMARYMVPEHVLFLDLLPKTPTEKIDKPALKRLFAETRG
ncbi:AMP-binding protein [Sphingosinicella microcystinivorans]|uniref:AMP-binding protein n=1 Tax=Sphingosinicella microcystinivorans TaxID=335406 RepID=UPI0022F3EEAD|nr:AMP-binding protein [Sphingosinicella microcystinivorans]WBX85315.1 AMP-binding protein [Sphingosinicella microcystinivorans]